MPGIPLKSDARQTKNRLNSEAVQAIVRLRRGMAAHNSESSPKGLIPDLSQIVQSAADCFQPDDALKLIDRGAGAVAKRWEFGHSFDDLAACEAAAQRVRLCSRTAGTLSSAAAGIGGLAALPADFAVSLLIMSFTAHATAAAYGFGSNSPRDQLIRLHAIGLAAETSESGRRRRKAEINDLLQGVSMPKDIHSMAVIQQLMQAMLPSVMDNLFHRFAAKIGVKAVPVASAVTGGFLGYRIQMRTSAAAVYTYDARWRIEGPGV